MPVAQKLAEKVLESCSTKLKPYLTEAVKKLNISFDDYSKVVFSMCQESSDAVEQNDAVGQNDAVEENDATANEPMVSFSLLPKFYFENNDLVTGSVFFVSLHELSMILYV